MLGEAVDGVDVAVDLEPARDLSSPPSSRSIVPSTLSAVSSAAATASATVTSRPTLPSWLPQPSPWSGRAPRRRRRSRSGRAGCRSAARRAGSPAPAGSSRPRSASRSDDRRTRATLPALASDWFSVARVAHGARDVGLRLRDRPRRRGRRHGARQPPGSRRARRDHAGVLLPRRPRRLPAQPAPQGAPARPRRVLLPARPPLYDGLRIQPRVNPEALEHDVLAETCAAAADARPRRRRLDGLPPRRPARRAPRLRHAQRVRRPRTRPTSARPTRTCAPTCARSSPTSRATR